MSLLLLGKQRNKHFHVLGVHIEWEATVFSIFSMCCGRLFNLFGRKSTKVYSSILIFLFQRLFCNIAKSFHIPYFLNFVPSQTTLHKLGRREYFLFLR